MTPSPKPITELLIEWRDGDETALNRLMPLVYDELRRMASHYLRRERPEHTLQTAALVNEAYLKLVDHKGMRWQNRAHFYAVAAQAMRRILVDYARSRRAAKREGAHYKVELSDAIAVSEDGLEQALAIDEALTRLAEWDPRQCRVVELRFFGGLTED